MPIHFDFVAQSGLIYSDDVDMVVVPSASGTIGVLPKHAPLMAVIHPGEVVVKKAGEQDRYFSVTDGFVEVRPDKVVLLARSGEQAEDIDVARAEEARQRAEQWLATHPKGAERRDAMEAALRRSIMRLRIVEKRSRTRTSAASFREPNNRH